MSNQRLRTFSKIFILGNLLSAIAISPALAETDLLKTLIVTGKGVESIATTIAEVRLGVEVEGKTVEEVQQEIARRSSAVVELLRSRRQRRKPLSPAKQDDGALRRGEAQSQDVQKLRTTGVRLEPNYNRDADGNRQDIVGYTGINIVSFQIDQDIVGNLLDEAVAAGASRVDGISFTSTEEAEAAKEEALRKASINAQNKADVVLETLDLTANEIVNIKVDRANIESPQPIFIDRGVASRASESTPIIGGEQTVEADVTLQIKY